MLTFLADLWLWLACSCLNKHSLNRVDTDESPVDPRHPNRWYLPPNTGGYSSQFQYNAQFKLPDNLTCSHCVLQWWYVTANSCLPPDYNKFSFPASTWWSSGLSACGTVYGEEFWNCGECDTNLLLAPLYSRSRAVCLLQLTWPFWMEAALHQQRQGLRPRLAPQRLRPLP